MPPFTFAYNNNKILYFLSLKCKHFKKNLIWITTVSLLIALLHSCSLPLTQQSTYYFIYYIWLWSSLAYNHQWLPPALWVKSKFLTIQEIHITACSRSSDLIPQHSPRYLLHFIFLDFFQILRHTLLSERVWTHSVFSAWNTVPKSHPHITESFLSFKVGHSWLF